MMDRLGERKSALYCNRTATWPVRAGTRWTYALSVYRRISADKRDYRTHEDRLVCSNPLLHGGGQGFESPRLHSKNGCFAG